MKFRILYISILLIAMTLSQRVFSQPLTIVSVTKTDETCNYSNDGTITIQISGGVSPYNYYLIKGALFLNPPATTNTIYTFTGLDAGSYTIIVSDDIGTSVNDLAVVTQPPVLTGSITSQTDILCFGSGTGSVTIAGAGGTAPYTFNIDGGAFSPLATFNGLAAGSHPVQVKDVNSCLANVAVTINQPASAVSGSIPSQTNISCNGLSDGSVTIAGAGGTGPYTYNIDGGVFGASGTFNGLTIGAHTVQVKDANNCIVNVPVTITQPAILTGSITSQTDVLCFGMSTGSVTVAGAGGTIPYTFNIDGGAFGASATFNGLAAGPHPVQVKDANNCTTNVPITITQPASAVSGSIISQTDVSCNGLLDGSVTVAGAGGTGPYTYNIDGGAFGAPATFNGLAAGAHPVQVKDANNCTANVPVTITQPAVLSGSITSQTDVLCFGSSTGSVTIAGAGGTGPYTYNIDGGVFGAPGTFNGLAAGAHTVQVKDANNCTTNVPVTIIQPASAVSGSITSQTDVSCNGLSDGSVTIAGAGGTGPYTYNIDGGLFGVPATFNGLTVGAHTVQVKDANLCTANVPVTITQPAILTGSITSQTDVLCFGSGTGSVTVAGAGGTVPYTYNIDGGAFGASATFNGLAAGAHTVQVKDANNCTANVPVTITQPASAVSGSITSQTNVSCNGLSDGSVTVAGAGGTGPYTYNIDGGAFGASGTFNALAAGAHTVQVKDANNCIANVPVTIIQPAILTGSIAGQTNILCFGSGTGSVTVAGAGGTGPYTYNIDGGAFGASGTFIGLAAGAHTVQVKDVNNCTANVPITITEPASAVSGSITSQTNVSCNGLSDGTVIIAGAGGTGPYTYNIDGGAFGASGTFNALGAGAHIVQVKDANNCTANVPVTITQPAVLSGSISSQNNMSCNGLSDGSVTIAGAGGTGPYTYNIDGGVFGASGTFNALAAGAHTVQVKDANNCTANVPVTIIQPPILSGSITGQTNVLCFGSGTGSVTVAGAGGTGPYNYNIDGGAFGASGTFNALTGGPHTVQVKDANSCTANVAVTITQPASAVSGSIIGQTNISCNGLSDGSVTVAGAGGTGPYTYNIDGGAFGASGTFNSLTAGAHTVQVRDANNCIANVAVTITQPAVLSGSISSQNNISCNGLSDGSITIAGAGGTGPYTYNIDGGAFGASGTFNALAAGGHPVQVKDANNCTANVPVTITQPAILSGSITGQIDVICFGSSTGSVTVAGTGGTIAYTFNIDGGVFGASGTFNALAAGPHTVQVKDANNCTANVAVTITQPASAVSGSITSQTNVLCFGSSTGSVTVAGAGGTVPYTYNIDGGVFGVSGTFNTLAGGVHTVQVRDANFCTANVIVTITQPATAVSGSITGQTDISCNGLSNGSVTVTGAGGTGPYTYNIDGGAFGASGTFNALTSGAHTVQVKDANNCTANVVVTIIMPAAITATITSTPYVDAANQGTVTISGATGGTGPLTFSISGVGGPFSLTTFYNNLPMGTYPIVIKDVNGCTYQQNVIISLAPPLNVTVTITQATCNGSNNASISLTATNGMGLVQYSIDDSASWSSNGLFGSLGPGTYYVFTKDAIMRYFKDTLTLTEPLAISVFSSVTPASCSSMSSDGAIDITVIGGTGTKTYSWSNGAVSQDIAALNAGGYTVTITDQNNCIRSQTITVTSITTVTANAGRDTVLCFGEGITLNGKGGAIYSWAPSTGLSNPNISNPIIASVTGNISYVMTVVGLNSCFDTDTLSISVRPLRELHAGNDTSILINNTVILHPTGDPFVNYSWSPVTGLSNPNIATTNATPVTTTAYVLTAVDSFGCSKKDTLIVTIIERLKIYNVFSPNNDGKNDFWDIDNAEFFPGIIVEVYTRWGQKLFSSKGYSNDKRWDGTFKGKDVPIGTYYYVVVPYKGATAQTGPLTIVR